ncbi:MAG TPA: class D sortase [Acidimicrobiales bacterium]|nr:class D sortase [Acidimicrobiales bacterium]
MRPVAVARSVVGATLLWGSAAVGGYAVSWTLRSEHAAHRVDSSGGTHLASSAGFDASTSCRAGTPRVGQLAGFVEIPSLSLRAPVEQGESGPVLSDAVGHDVSSVWPGADGTAVLAAHDVSYFARIGSLRPGSRIVYVSACRRVTFEVTGHRIVPSGSPVADSSGPTLVLDTCWPNDALWWTPDRELVLAREVSSRPAARHSSSSSRPATPPIAVPAPPALLAEGLTLDTNPTLLGTMAVTGSPASSFVESPGPLEVEQAALTAYYGTLHAIASGRRDWFDALAPHVAFPAALSGSSVAGYLTRLTVDVEAAGTRPTGALLTAEVDLRSPSGTTTPARITVTCRIAGGELLVGGWRWAP